MLKWASMRFYCSFNWSLFSVLINLPFPVKIIDEVQALEIAHLLSFTMPFASHLINVNLVLAAKNIKKEMDKNR